MGNRACNAICVEVGIMHFARMCPKVLTLKKHEVLSFICQSCKKLPDLSKLHPQPQCDVSVQVSPMHDHPEPGTMHVMSELVKKVGDLELAMRDLRVKHS